MSRYIKERFKDFDGYTPGEQPKDKKYIKLNTNESPFPPGPKVLNAINKENLSDLRLYPSPDQIVLKKDLSNYLMEVVDSSVSLTLTWKNIFVSNGSDDILNFAFLAYSGDDIPAVYPDISYGFYSVFANFQGVESKVIPLKEDYTIHVKDYVFNDGIPRFIVIANPNAPTGISIGLEDIEEILKGNPKGVVLIDEAYVDFGGDTALPLINKYDNLIICRTYSKSASLAGARLGYAIASEEIILDLEMVKASTNPYSINRMTELAGLAVLEEYEYYQNNCNKIIRTRERVRNALMELGLAALESKANFLFVGTGENALPSRENDSVGKPKLNPWAKVSGKELYLLLKEKGILVRWFDKDRIRDYIRITIGLDEEMDTLIRVLSEIKKQVGTME